MESKTEKIVVIIEKPNTCGGCPFAYFTEGVYHDYCRIAGYDTEIEEATKPEWCPLKSCQYAD